MKREYTIRNSEKCYRFKEEAIVNHAPHTPGIYELVTFDENKNPEVLFVGGAFDKTINQCLEAHAKGINKPNAEELLAQYPNLYFDFICNTENVKSLEDAQDVHWWLVQKYNPKYNNVKAIQNSGRPGEIHVIEKD